MPENKKKEELPVREVKPKTKRFGLTVPIVRYPHDDFLPQKSDEGTNTRHTSNTSTPSITSITSTPSNTSNAKKTPDSPEKDWQKVPNSIARDAIPTGVFTGKSKQVWDYFWSISRGSIKKNRFVRVTRPEIKQGAGLGSFVTVDNAVARLQEIGLIRKVEVVSGKHDGNQFEVFEWNELETATSSASDTSDTSYTQKVELLVLPESSNTSSSSGSINTGVSDEPKTLLKTLSFKSDDEGLIVAFLEKMNSAAKNKTGRNLSRRDLESLADIAELLIAETEIAAARTNSISAYIPFMAENLRRRLHAKPKFEKKGTEAKKDTVGKTFISAPEPLDEESKINLLKTYQEGLAEYGMEWVDQNESYFTPEDWQWIKSKLETQD